MGADGPIATVEIEEYNLNRTIQAIDSQWNARRHEIATQLGAFRDAALKQRTADGKNDYSVAAALFAINDAAQSTFLDGSDVVGSVSDMTVVSDGIKAAPKVAAQVGAEIQKQAQEQLDGMWSRLVSILSSLWITPAIVLALLMVGGGAYLLLRRK